MIEVKNMVPVTMFDFAFSTGREENFRSLSIISIISPHVKGGHSLIDFKRHEIYILQKYVQITTGA